MSGWPPSRYPGLDLFSHDGGHLWGTLFGWGGHPHFSLFHRLSYVLLGAGFWLLAAAWDVLHKAQRGNTLAP